MSLGATTTVTQVLFVVKCSGFIGAGHKNFCDLLVSRCFLWEMHTKCGTR